MGPTERESVAVPKPMDLMSSESMESMKDAYKDELRGHIEEEFEKKAHLNEIQSILKYFPSWMTNAITWIYDLTEPSREGTVATFIQSSRFETICATVIVAHAF